jgi:hypothetical protein
MAAGMDRMLTHTKVRREHPGGPLHAIEPNWQSNRHRVSLTTKHAAARLLTFRP